MGRKRVDLKDKRVIMNVTVHPTTYQLVEALAAEKYQYNLSQAVEAVLIKNIKKQ